MNSNFRFFSCWIQDDNGSWDTCIYTFWREQFSRMAISNKLRLKVEWLINHIDDGQPAAVNDTRGRNQIEGWIKKIAGDQLELTMKTDISSEIIKTEFFF